ncbi:MAG: hypothetical protein AB7V57_20980, partial [Verrucomicrobiales bacterium]
MPSKSFFSSRVLFLFCLCGLLLGKLPAVDTGGLHFPPKDGSANGKIVVLISGDEESRTEESFPMLA